MWQADSQYQDRHGSMAVPVSITMGIWFDYRIQNIVGGLAPNTLRNYRERYKFNTQPIIGCMQLKVLHTLLGHANIQTTNGYRYVHTTDESADQSVKQFEKRGIGIKFDASPRQNGVKMA